MAYETITDLKNNIEWYENRIAQLNRDSQKICAISAEHFQHEMESARTGLAGYKRLLAEALAKRKSENQAKQSDIPAGHDMTISESSFCSENIKTHNNYFCSDKGFVRPCIAITFGGHVIGGITASEELVGPDMIFKTPEEAKINYLEKKLEKVEKRKFLGIF